jgi:hypothetical protein
MSVPFAGLQNIEYGRAWLSIDVFRSPIKETAHAFFIRGLEDDQERRGFELFEQYDREIAGIQADYVHYKRDDLLPWPSTPGGDIPPRYYWIAVFEREGLIYEIETLSETSLVDDIAADFQHVLATFTILS